MKPTASAYGRGTSGKFLVYVTPWSEERVNVLSASLRRVNNSGCGRASPHGKGRFSLLVDSWPTLELRDELHCLLTRKQKRGAMKITAAVTREKGQPFSIEELEIEEPRSDEVLVKVAATGICHTDLIVRDQWLPVPLPIVLGHEGAGVV